MDPNTSTFDPDSFMQQTIDAPLETEFKLCPEGDYRASIDDFTSEAFEQIDFEYKKGLRAGQPGSMTKFSVPWIVDSDDARTALGRDKVVVYQQLIIDRDASGGLDFGTNKNVNLGKVRDAVGQNNPGPWSLGQLRGAGPCIIKVVHRDFVRKDGSKTKIVEVEKVVRLV